MKCRIIIILIIHGGSFKSECFVFKGVMEQEELMNHRPGWLNQLASAITVKTVKLTLRGTQPLSSWKPLDFTP